MNIYVLNPSFEIIDVVDDYKSIIWSTRYFSSGDFELHIPATARNINILTSDNLLCREQDVNGDEFRNVMIIQRVQIVTDVDEGDILTVTGKCLKSIVGRRIIWNQMNLTGNVETSVRQVLNENIISPQLAARKIDNFQLAEVTGFTDTMEIQLRGENIEEWLEETCSNYGYGWNVYVKDKKMIFYLYAGTDRSYNQSENPYVVFSPDFDNLLTSDYTHGKENYKNAALVAGEGEGTEQKFAEVGTANGLNRYEEYIEATNMSTNGETIAEDQYMRMLSNYGQSTLNLRAFTETFEGDVVPNGNYVLNKDYFLGDIVQVINAYGIAAAPRIIEIIDSEDEGGRTVIPTFSTWEV